MGVTCVTIILGSCRLSVQIRSEGSNDPGITAPGSSAIIVGGADYSLKSQGFNLAVLQQKTGKQTMLGALQKMCRTDHQ